MSPTDLAGTVVDFETTRPLAGRTVYVGGQSTTTGIDGAFRIAGVGSSYDAIVVDPDGTSVSVFKGMSRRDPVLSHRRLPPETSAHRATLSGDVSGGGNYPLASSDSVDIYFFSADADNQFSLGHGLPANLQGPGFGAMYLDWDGAGSVSGHLMALGIFPTVGGSGGWFVDQPITLHDGQDAFVNVALASVATSGQIAGNIQTPAHWPVAGKAVFYRLPIVHAAVRIPLAQTSDTNFKATVPDLSKLGGQLCAEVESASDATPGSAVTEVCGISLGQSDFVLTVEPPPALITPTSTTTLNASTEFSWSAFDHGVHLLDLVSTSPSRSLPNVHVFTSGTSLIWPDLGPVGVSFPADASYSVTIAGFGPYADMNAAFGSAGIAANIAPESRRSYSNTLYLATGS